MRNSGTDRELFDLIKSTLDNYEENYILGAWENFSNIRKRRKKKILWWVGSGIAASIMIGWLGYKWIHSDPFNHSSEIYSKTEIPITKDKLIKPRLIQPVTSSNEKISQINNPVNKSISQSTLSSQLKKSVPEYSVIGHINPDTVQVIKIQSNHVSCFNDSVANKIVAMYSLTTMETKIESKTDHKDDDKTRIELNPSDSSIFIPINNQLNHQLSIEEDVTDNPINQRLKFGINFSPGVNYTNTASSFKYSGGVSADLNLSSNFQFSSGLQFEYQSVINSSPNDNNSIPNGQTIAKLVNFDLPLNITWKFYSKKTKAYYVAGGLSSLVYLSENYTKTSYSQQFVEIVVFNGGVESMTYKIVNVKSIEQKKEAPFNTFDFAGRVNIIFGMQQRISSKLFIHIEPYIKIPVSGLATQNLKFTTSGVSCKISF
jgi:hypothetical protein